MSAETARRVGCEASLGICAPLFLVGNSADGQLLAGGIRSLSHEHLSSKPQFVTSDTEAESREADRLDPYPFDGGS